MDSVFDHITLKNNKELTGIIDHRQTKQIYFFNLENTSDDYKILAIDWKANHPNLRFSIYITKFWPDIDLPKITLIPKINIKSSDRSLSPDDNYKPFQRIQIIKLT